MSPDRNERETEGEARWLLRFGVLGVGRPLEQVVRSRMERLFGCKLPEVRIHDSDQAGELANRMGARAFTIGSRIFAPPGELNPEMTSGAGLLAHELVHATQEYGHVSSGQGQATDRAAGARMPSAGPGTPRTLKAAPSVDPASDPEEEQARAAELAARRAEDFNPPKELATAPDPDVVADKVYRLMQQELLTNRERGALL